MKHTRIRPEPVGWDHEFTLTDAEAYKLAEEIMVYLPEVDNVSKLNELLDRDSKLNELLVLLGRRNRS